MNSRYWKLQLRVVSTVLAVTFFGEQAFAAQALSSQKIFLDMDAQVALSATESDYLVDYLDVLELKAQAKLATEQLEQAELMVSAQPEVIRVQDWGNRMQQSMSEMAAHGVRCLLHIRSTSAASFFAWQPNVQMRVLAKAAIEKQIIDRVQAEIGQDTSLQSHAKTQLARFIARRVIEAQGMECRMLAGVNKPTSDTAALAGLSRAFGTTVHRAPRKSLHAKLHWNQLPDGDLNPDHQFFSAHPRTGPPYLKINTFKNIQTKLLDALQPVSLGLAVVTSQPVLQRVRGIFVPTSDLILGSAGGSHAY